MHGLVWRERYGVQGVALGAGGLEVLVDRQLDGAAMHELAETVGPRTRVRDIGPIFAVSCCGEAVQTANAAPGTLGCIVEDAFGAPFGLTCDHVIGATAGQTIGDFVYCNTGVGIGLVGRGTSINVSTSAANRADAALVDLRVPSANLSSITGIAGAPAGVNRSLALGDDVKKSGAATSVTHGRFAYIVTMNVPYPAGLARYVDQICIDGGGVVFADKGDSGAVVLDDANEVAGLLFAAAPQSCLGFANWIDDIEAELGVTVA